MTFHSPNLAHFRCLFFRFRFPSSTSFPSIHCQPRYTTLGESAHNVQALSHVAQTQRTSHLYPPSTLPKNDSLLTFSQPAYRAYAVLGVLPPATPSGTLNLAAEAQVQHAVDESAPHSEAEWKKASKSTVKKLMVKETAKGKLVKVSLQLD